MVLPLQITFRHMDRSEAVETLVREKAAKLDHFAPHITSCRVVIQPAGKQHRHGNLYEVHIDLTLPGREIAVSREPSQYTEHRDLVVILHDAFDAVFRQLEDYVRHQRRDEKRHEPMPHARVCKLFPAEDYGFLATLDGREIYFHRHSVLHDAFDHLALGMEVMFVEEDGAKGPQASTVRPAGRHHHQ